MCAVVYFITPETRRRRKKKIRRFGLGHVLCVSRMCGSHYSYGAAQVGGGQNCIAEMNLKT